MGAVVHAELGQDGLDMVPNGFGADVEIGGDLPVAAPGGKQVEDLALTASQRMRIGQCVGPPGVRDVRQRRVALQQAIHDAV